ncbi:MAG: SDR family oxidoreductase [Bacteroidales bacterium]|jgi:NAD(P)-dependent dehydrogenase (short-subunit alcohol dehydrogenase family)|nr:SDR family oxidoreductase [Bacteroidales bacterium]
MKTVLITGANSGIGKATATELSAKGYQIVFIARDLQKAEAVKNEIISSSGNSNVDFIIADLLSLTDVRKSAELFKERYQKLDILINNAGVCLPERKITVDGFEEMFQINHLSHFLLTNKLLDLLKNSDDPRIINVSSAGYKAGRFDPENLQSEKKFSSFTTYCDTKLLNILFTFELAEKLKEIGVTVNALHPGVVRTNFAGELKGVFGLINNMFKPFLLSPKKGAETSVHLASSEEVRNITGKYFEKCKAVVPKNEFINSANQKLLWEKSMQFSGLKR